MIRCNRCILPASYPAIEFDGTGVCNYCRSGVVSKTGGREHGREVLRERVNAVKRNCVASPKYDCIVALSGGRDSTYVAYYVVRELGLRPLLFVNDNGMMPAETKRNIEKTAAILGVDVAIKHNDMRPNVRAMSARWMKNPTAPMVGALCTGCTAGISGGLIEVAKEARVGLIIHGGGGELASLGSSFPIQMLTGSIAHSKVRLAMGFARELARNPRYVGSPALVWQCLREAYYRFVWDPRRTLEIVVFSLYKFIEWNEQEIVETIKRELGWVRPAHSSTDWRTDCKLHRFKEYLYRDLVGFTKNDVLLSCLIRRGEMSREAALERLQNDNAVSPMFVEEFCNEIGVPYDELERLLAEPRRRAQTETQFVPVDALRPSAGGGARPDSNGPATL